MPIRKASGARKAAGKTRKKPNGAPCVYNALFPTTVIRPLPEAGTGDEVFSGVVGGAATGVDWLREPPGAVLELVEKENMVEVH